MPQWLERLLAALADACAAFGTSAEVGGVMPCRGRRPTVTLTCEGGGRFRATGSPVSGDGIYRWSVHNGSAELSATTGRVVSVVRVTPPTFDVDVYYEVDGEFSDSAVRTVTAVPRLIHFIWAGGTLIMPPPSFDVVCAWAAANAADGFKVILWIDRASYPQVEAAYQQRDAVRLAQLPIELWDITEHHFADPFVRYEIDKLWPNYGSSSDLLRYEILLRYGGAYFDSDVLPGPTRLFATRHFLSCKGPVFVCNFASQLGGMVGNDAFICSPGHPLMQAISTTVRSNYQVTTFNDAPSYNVMQYRLQTTVLRTGPGAVAQALAAPGLNLYVAAADDDPQGFTVYRPDGQGGVEGQRVVHGNGLEALKMDRGTVRLPDGDAANANGWLKVPVRHLPQQQAMDAAVAALHFETAQMQMLRIEGTAQEVLVAMTPVATREGTPAQQLRIPDPFTGQVDVIAQQLQQALG